MTYLKLLLLIYLSESFLLFHYSVATEIETIMTRTLPLYAMLSNAHLLNSTKCTKELMNLRDAIDRRTLWSLKVMDSSGIPKPGFVYGNNYWFGIQSQCKDVNNRDPLILVEKEIMNNSKYRHVEDEFPPYEVKYFVAYFRHNSTLQYHVRLPNENLVTLGMCLPATCSKDELFILLEKVFKDRSLIVGDLYSADFELFKVKDLIDDHRWLLSGTFISIMILLILTCLLMLIGTIYDVLIYQRRLKRHAKLLKSYENTNSSQTIDIKRKEEDPEDKLTALKFQSNIGRIFLSFSVYSNTKIIFNTKLNNESILVIHGLKFLSMLWVIMVHTIFYMHDYTDNKIITWRKSEGFANQVLSNSTLSVDTFFFLGGFLAVYLYFKAEKGKKKHRPFNYVAEANMFFMNLLKRFIRLTPAYMFAMGIFEINSMWYNYTSEFYMDERPYEICPKYWWRNILYIQNFFSRETMCMSWSWYLANDMQFFAISTFLLTLSSMYFNVAVILLSLLFITSTIVTGYISYIYDYVPTMDQQYHLLDILYDPPWTRIGPYIVGMVTGYIVIKLNNELQWKKKTIILFWILGSACNVLVLFGLWKRSISTISAAFYVALNRTVWGVGLAWLLIACVTNHGGIVNKILSFKGWIPFSRLTYSTYLLNPIIINSIYLHSETSVHVDFLSNSALFLGNFVISYVCAYAFTMMFETPYILLMKQFIDHTRKK
nr:nose resistant to fluoxetine protein 6-like isoform X1 [Vespula vulgaris]XP_050859871.1 nose resistant to fluoxetine protein 6-like isoform X1 [Vespula vulgaris]XP_050859872.1 nose resistant to fluoxetine protein 6-like isoform X1 [Vespula vulgaris]XP_050859873.1 nose resistant to fluoxetine protein 6-like isoform X1 [Vespula vulgaris]XP_050859874.1 nose resistant to fluoxetine protein 6-like isoform X1 [Vespula vulgaris]XP_050859875.1 nose resistant to fluoxetine protein 6-like isoform X1 